MEMKGSLMFWTETGTEGGYWAFQDEQFTTHEPPEFGVFARTKVWDAKQPERGGVMGDVEVCKGGVWLPLPDLIQQDPDYVLSSLFRGEKRGDRDADARLMEKYAFSITYKDDDFGTPRTEPNRPYGVSKDEISRGTVQWDDGSSEQRQSDSLLVEKSSYEGLHVLKDGDVLTIFEKDGEKVHWQGTISLIDCGLFKEDAFGMWIHADQDGVEREEWARPFMEEWPAVLLQPDGEG